MNGTDNPNAFPLAYGENACVVKGGMSLRDYFAGQAVAGLLAAQDLQDLQQAVRDAYLVADLMLEERQ